MEKKIKKDVWSDIEEIREESGLPPIPTEKEIYDETYIYESPDKGDTIYKRKFREYPIERERIK